MWRFLSNYMNINLSEKNKTWIGIVVILMAGLALNYHYAHRLDIVSDDDDLYFMFGMDYLKGKYRGPDDGALYCLWHLAIQLITNDSIKTFYWNWIFLTVVPFIATFLLLRSLKINTWVGLWLTLLFMFSDLNYTLTPKLTHFTLIIIAIGLAYANTFKKSTQKLLVITITALVASYVRPEMYVAALIFLVWLIVVSVKNKNYSSALWALGLVVVSGIVFGTPIRENDRSLWTFKVYFAIHYLEQHPEIKLSPWNHFNEINEQVFGRKIKSPFDAFFSEPQLVSMHIWENIKLFSKLTTQFLKQIFWEEWSFMYRKYVAGIGLLALLYFSDIKATWTNIKNHFTTYWLFWVVLVIMLLPSLMSTTLLFPRAHYILYHLLFYLSIAGVLFGSIQFKKNTLTVPAIGIIAINLALCALFLWPHAKTAVQNKAMPNLAFAKMLQDLPLKNQVNLLGGDAPFSYNRFVGPNWTFFYYDIHRPKNFADFVQKQNINCIVANQKFNDYFKQDTTYQSFRTNAKALGFILTKQTNTHAVFVKQ